MQQQHRRPCNNSISLNCNSLNQAVTTGTVVIFLLLNTNGHPGWDKQDKISMVIHPDCRPMKCWQPLNLTTGIFPIINEQPRPLLHIILMDCILISSTTNPVALLPHQKKLLLLQMPPPLSQIFLQNLRIFHKPCMSTLLISPV